MRALELALRKMTFFGTLSADPGCLRKPWTKRFPGGLWYAAFYSFGVLVAIILIVEDEMFIRQAAVWTLGDLGHTVLAAQDMAGALSHLTASQHIDVLFVDIRLSAMATGGYDVANQAIGLRAGLRVLYTSGRPLTAEMSEQFVFGGQFLQKPYSPAQLEQSVGTLLH